MGRLDTALNGKNGVLYGHKKITYEVPCTDCPNPHDCDPDCNWNPITEECDCPCQQGDPGYECDCKCKDNEVCIDGECREIEPPETCGTCYKLVDGVCVRDYDECPDNPPVPPIPDECPKCYTYDSSTGKCKFNPEECPPDPECGEGEEWDEELGKCVKIPEILDIDCILGDPECPLEKTDCFDWGNVGDGARINADGKITGKVGVSKLNGQRYWFSTLCYNRVEFFARITTIGEGDNKSGIEHGYAETKGNLDYTVTAYYGDYVQLHHNDVLKIIIRSDGTEDTYIKSYVRPGVWTGRELFSLKRNPELPPSGEINWMMCGVVGGAEIWDIRAYPTDEIVIPQDEAIVEVTPENIAGCISYDLNGCKGSVCGYKKAFGTVRDSDNHLGQTMYFGWSNPFRWANGETKRNYVTYRDGVLTIPRGSLFRYVGPMMNSPSEGVSWRTDMKFTVNCPSDYGTGKIFLWFGVCDKNGENPLQRRRVEAYASDFVDRDLWLTYETAYTCSYPEYVEDLMLYYWTGTGKYRGYDMIWSSYNFINHDQRGPYYYYMDIQIQDNCNIDSIDISYMSEGQGSYYIRY